MNELDTQHAAGDNSSDTLSKERGARFLEIRNYFGKKQTEMDHMLGIGKKSWQKYESGGQAPGGKVLNALTQHGINVNWVLEGGFGGPMLLEDVDKHLKKRDSSRSTATYKGIDGSAFEAEITRSMELAAQLRKLEQTVKEEASRFGYTMPDSAAASLAQMVSSGDISTDVLVRFIALLKTVSKPVEGSESE